MGNLLKSLKSKEDNNNSKKKIENIVFLIIILVVTLIIINTIWRDDASNKENKQNTNTSTNETLADENQNNDTKTELEGKLEKILGTIKNVGRVNVLINYAESISIVPLYNESTTTSSTEEGDSSGGTRNVTETETKKDIVFSESSGSKEPITQKKIMPTIQGAIITAEGAKDANVKTDIINAVCAVTGLSIDKVQVFEINT